MKKLSRVLAAVLSVLMIMSCFVGCHKKGEIAYTIGDHTYTSAMYSCVLYISASSARGLIDTYISDNKIETKKVDYSSYKFNEERKVDPKGTISYSEHVKTEAVRILTQYSVIMDKMKAEKLEMDKDAVETAKVQASYYWYVGCDYDTYSYYTSYGADPSSYFTPYATYFEPNGVALSTYEQYMVYEYMYNFYFEHLYDEGGAKEVSKEDLNKYLSEHYTIADIINFSKVDSEQKQLSDDELTKLKKQADDYAKRINDGETFEVIYKDYEDSLKTEEEKKEEEKKEEDKKEEDKKEDTSSNNDKTDDKKEEDKKEEYTPESYTNVFGAEGTDYESKLYDDINKLTVGPAVVIDDTDSKSYVLAVKGDILKESYWLNNMRSSILLDLKQDEYDKDLDEAAKSLTVTVDKHAIAPFGVKDIKFQ